MRLTLFFLLLPLFLYCQFIVGPKIKIDENEHSFGKVQQGTVLTHTFKIYNIGSEDLEIEQIKASCGCTDFELGNNVIEPGKSTELKIKLSTDGYSGYVKKSFWIFSNDPIDKELILYINANIIDPEIEKESFPRLELSDMQIDFGNVKEGEIINYPLKLKNTGKKPLIISNINPSCGCTVVNFSKKELLPGEETTVDIKLDTKGFSGRIKKSVHIFSNNKFQNVVTFYMFANVIK
ncbi:MAG TPA: DUF1573 domain-containing protein [Ignavibacteriales bacterium]|nr:DUF1573 domain-containing protein [Ignavibacteriales bacterium]HOL81445.1 DUF1573 domain-containing protein [Ignavibacteriales bacterium]HOM65343.1 DUF1573 domain-containing protein [Ignavibacteriales bacterium]HPD66971.1 DUF1573 domain-containing protein [Ignavibacteriales bacterium]HPP33628.1 DUF1573 domain-containing protein [Ignavibacteriales bacterium]